MKQTTYHLNTPVSICLLSDLHERDFSFLSDVREHRPDLIAVAGDAADGFFNDGDRLVSERMLPFLSACADIAPTFFSLGNHECMLHQDDIDAIGAAGVTVLDNSWISRNGVCIGGLTSGHATEYRRQRGDTDIRYPEWITRKSLREKNTNQMRPDLSWLSDFADQPGYKVLLSHHPEYWPLVKDYDIDLMLSGHAHGGQIRIVGQGLFAPGQGFLPKLTSGVHDGRLVISRGLANTAGPIPRLFNPREVVYICK